DEKAMPLRHLHPRLRLQLIFSVRRDDTYGVFVGGDGPQNDPRDEGGLADAVAGGGGELDRFARRNDTGAEILEDLTLPLLRPRELLEFARLAPRKGEEDEAERVGGEL